jgi:hypothetical protein
VLLRQGSPGAGPGISHRLTNGRRVGFSRFALDDRAAFTSDRALIVLLL